MKVSADMEHDYLQ